MKNVRLPQSPALSRRRFAQATIAAGAALGFPAVLSARNPNDKLSIAIIGAACNISADFGHDEQTVI
mgnify:CR=1 FL=1